MADKAEKSQRRKSLSVFGPALSTSFTAPNAAHDRAASDGQHVLKKKRSRPSSGFFGVSAAQGGVRSSSPLAPRRPGTAEPNSPVDNVSEGTRHRSRSFQRAVRTSMLGSLRSMQSTEDDDKLSLRGARSKASSFDDEDRAFGSIRNVLGSVVIHHGEVQTSGGMWRKKNQYLVLTDTHLVRFKSQGKAAEMFPSIPASWGRSAAGSRQSIASINSFQEMQMAAYNDITSGIPLNTIVAVYRLDDGRPFFSIEVSHVDERTQKASIMHMQLNDPEESELWLVGIRSTAEKVRLSDPLPFDHKAVEYVARALEQERDYDPQMFHLFRVVQRSSNKPGGRSSSDDLAKLSSTVCFLAIGIHKIHLIPLQKYPNRASVVSLSELDQAMSFGILTLTSLSMQRGDDTFQLTFRVPLRSSFTVHLASSFSADISLWIRQCAEFLRPQWIHQPFTFSISQELDDQIVPPPFTEEDYGCFDRTLIAYSAAYDIDTSNIRYTINYDCEDAPCFTLLPPASRQRQKYNALELLALMKALRYNECFSSISFNGVNLDILHDVRDYYGIDKDATMTRSGVPINIPDQEKLSVLSQEIRALALKNKRLRRLDFSFCLTRTPDASKGAHDPGCGVPEAIFPLCRRQLTNVDWVVLNGIKLGDSDLDYLVDAASQRASHLRALEVSNCGLSIHDLDLILGTITAQETTLEAINISGLQGRLSPELFHQQIGYFGHIRKINLSQVSKNTGPEPLIAPETLLTWRLEELSLSQTAMNEQTVDSISAYLSSSKSNTLREVHLNQCGLTGKDVAIFLHSMTREDCEARNLHLHVSENRLHTGYSLLFDAIAQNKTPTHLTMRMVEFQKEDHFRQLVEALRKNTSLKYLDISKASLPYDAGPETCKALQLMFEDNNTLEELDISGEFAHLDVARFGIGLNNALTGLKKNTSLKILKIEHQKLGLPGASTLASVLEENTTLREVYCENNEINLQSFTVLVNGLEKNKTVLHLPSLDRDREYSLEKVRREIEMITRDTSQGGHSAASSIRRTIQAAVSSGSGGNKLTKLPTHTVNANGSFNARVPPSSTTTNTASTAPPRLPSNDVLTVLRSLGQKWDVEVSRLQRYLIRNYNLANGIEVSEDGTVAYEGVGIDDAASDGRPNTAASLGTFLEKMTFDVTSEDSGLSPFSEVDQNPTLGDSATSSDNVDYFETDSITPLSLNRSSSLLSSRRNPLSREDSRSGSVRLQATSPTIGTETRFQRSGSNSSLSTDAEPTLPVKYPSSASSLREYLGARAAERENKRREKRKGKGKDSEESSIISDQPPRLDWTPPDIQT
ncbi:hypothetical protein FQN54_008605 [Arachnomyces sp. PD_36]|nr:hypothetical protein FQN54_008605 [Arachnomyces sp. PD_36]